MGAYKKISEEQFFKLLEGDLPTQEETRLHTMIEADEDLRQEWELWKMTMQDNHTGVVFDGKEQLKSLTEERKGIIVLWPKIAWIAAILVLGVICFWMLQDTEKMVKPQANINTDTIVKDNLLEDLLNLEVKKTVSTVTKDITESKSDEQNIALTKKIKKSDRRVGSKTAWKNGDILIAKVNPKDSAPVVVKIKVANTDTSSTAIKPKDNVDAAVVQENTEVVYGTKKEKGINGLNRLLSLKNKFKNDVNEWFEKPQIALEGTKDDRKLSLKNDKIKLSIKR